MLSDNYWVKGFSLLPDLGLLRRCSPRKDEKFKSSLPGRPDS